MKQYVDYNGVKCKICTNDTTIWGVVDFNKSCEERNGMYLPYTGIPIYYLKCSHCGFIFTTDFDMWTTEDFKENIYNDEYIKVDPEYNGKRSQGDAQWFLQHTNIPKTFDILDYGAGPAVLGQELGKHGYKVDSWDTMWGIPMPTKKYDLIMSWEVMEHTPDPIATVNEMMRMLKPGGSILTATLSTGIMPNPRDPAFWYLSPRNGHVCMYSDKSLDELFGHVNMNVTHVPWSIHVASPK